MELYSGAKMVNKKYLKTKYVRSKNQEFTVLKRLREKVRRKQPKLLANNSWILQPNNAPAHTALAVRVFLATK
jgi:hypothetical protein